MEDEVEICQIGDKGRLWLTLLNEACRQGVPSCQLAWIFSSVTRLQQRKITEQNEWNLCVGKKANTNFNACLIRCICFYTSAKYSLFCLNRSLAVTHTYHKHTLATLVWFHFPSNHMTHAWLEIETKSNLPLLSRHPLHFQGVHTLPLAPSHNTL